MRVLHLINAFNRGGLESWLLNMLRIMQSDVCAMDVCCKGDDEGPWAPEARQLGARVYHCPLGPLHIGFMQGLEQILGQGTYDLVHNHLGVYSGFPVWISHKMGVPIITSFHATRMDDPHKWWLRLPVLLSLRSVYGRFSIRYALRNSELVTAVSRGVLERIMTLDGSTRSKCRVVHLGIPIPDLPDDSKRAELRDSLGFPQDSQLVLHVGRFTEEKNHRAMLSIFGRILAKFPDAKLLLVGDGPLRPRIERQAAEMKLGRSVRFYGYRDDVAALMSVCDAFLFPSIHEGLPVAVLEAGAAGLPVVGTLLPGLMEAVVDGSSALLHDVSDIEGMADSVIRVLSDRSLARSIGDAARAHVIRNFSDQTAAQRLLTVYEECLERARN